MSFSRRIALGPALALGIAAVAVLVLAGLLIGPNSDRNDEAVVRGPALAGDTRLVLLVVVDQFPGAYLDRFAPYFGERGFNLLLREGASIESAAYSYVTTDTCPGHSVIATGAWPNRSGIVANSWFDRAAQGVRLCSSDPEAVLLPEGGRGHSPRAQLAPAIGDLIKSASTGSARVIGVGGKGYAAIMLGGARADAVYWSDDTLMVSSSYYLDQLPGWVRKFNSSGRFSTYFGSRWERVLSTAVYDSVGADDVAFEDGSHGLGRTFPHVLDGGGDEPGAGFVSALAATPFHDIVIAEFAMQALHHEHLGKDEHTDLLAIALSANDRIGHRFGPDSHEVLDALVRTDRLLAHLFATVDATVGLEHALLVVTSDHGVAPFPELSRLRAGPGSEGDGDAARISEEALLKGVTDALDAAYGRPADGRWIAFHEYPYLYLDARVLAAAGAPRLEAERTAAQAVAQVPGVLHAWSHEELLAASAGDGRDGVPPGVLLSFYAERSGSVLYEVSPYFLVDDDDLGTNHGTRWLYDAHVPLLWKGPGIRPGRYPLSATPADVAPTLAALLGIPPGSRMEGQVIHEILSSAD